MRHVVVLPLFAALAGCVSVGSINADTLGVKGNVDTQVGTFGGAGEHVPAESVSLPRARGRFR